MHLHRAYGLLEVKSFDDDAREIEGLASTPEPDRLGDIVEPKGAVFRLPLPLLWQHNAAQPVGEVVRAKPEKDGIPIRARIFKASTPALRDRLDEAWESLKIGLVKGLSIGFRPLEMEPIEDTYSLRFTQWEWLELSVVTVPANASATISVIKSIDRDLLAASGQTPIVRLDASILRRARRNTRPGVVYL